MPATKMMNAKDSTAPMPVRPAAIRYHGLFGLSSAAQHLIVDYRWTPSNIVDIYATLNELLKSLVNYGKRDVKFNRARRILLSKSLKMQCVNGRLKLQKITSGDNSHKIHNLLMKYKEMQRLYQRMPIDLVLENINQRTFTMRKERDRLQARLNEIKRKYKCLLLERSRLHNRLTYQSVQVSEGEIHIHMLLKKIQNSRVRLSAIRVINSTYKNMQQVLLHDEIFYEHILNSLHEDIKDQRDFIKQILHLGMPISVKSRELDRKLLRLEVNVRKNQKSKIDIVNSLNKSAVRSQQEVKIKKILTANPRRYIRHTDSMLILKRDLQSIESTIKTLKKKVLSSQAKEIYPRFKSQMEGNQKTYRVVQRSIQSHEMLQTKMKRSNLLAEVLVNNLSLEEVNRMEHIKQLKAALEKEIQLEGEFYEQMKNRADVYVTMRISLWNLFNTLININLPNPRARRVYKSSALKLPLLKFEHLDSIAIPPEMFTEDVDEIMHAIKRRLYKLMKGFNPTMMESIQATRTKYHSEFLIQNNSRLSVDQDDDHNEVKANLLIDKSVASIPNRKHIKAQSAKLVEYSLKLQ